MAKSFFVKTKFDNGRTVSSGTITEYELRKAFKIPEDADITIHWFDYLRARKMFMDKNVRIEVKWERIS